MYVRAPLGRESADSRIDVDEYVLFIAPTKLQLDVYTAILGAKNVAGLLRGGSGGASLGMSQSFQLHHVRYLG